MLPYFWSMVLLFFLIASTQNRWMDSKQNFSTHTKCAISANSNDSNVFGSREKETLVVCGCVKIGTQVNSLQNSTSPPTNPPPELHYHLRNSQNQQLRQHLKKFYAYQQCIRSINFTAVINIRLTVAHTASKLSSTSQTPSSHHLDCANRVILHSCSY